jgi:fatty-acyl-CoA synthase
MERERCSVVLVVPAILQMWLRCGALERIDLGSLRWLISGGAPCPPPLIHRWHREHGIVVRQGYGMTEVGVNCFAMSNDVALGKPGTVGRPVLHSRARIVDDQGRDVPPGCPGQLLLAGAHVCSGYWKAPEATAAVLQDGWFSTGDMAVCDSGGDYTIVGRSKDMIISGGENVYAAEVETVFREYADVADAALVGRPDPTWGEVGWLAVLPASERAIDVDALLEHARARLAHYKIPKRVLIRQTLPYSPSGKVVKAELRRELALEWPEE